MILQALTDYYRVLEQAGKIDAPGWAPVKVSYALLLSENGTLEQVIDIQTDQARSSGPGTPWKRANRAALSFRARDKP